MGEEVAQFFYGTVRGVSSLVLLCVKEEGNGLKIAKLGLRNGC